MKDQCNFCKEIIEINRNIFDPFFVKKLKTGYISMGYKQYYKGYCLFISNTHASELHELDVETKKQFLFEMTLVAEAIYLAFKPIKLNIEILGNSHPHLHWHIIPRYKKDILPKIPIWNNPSFLMSKKIEAGPELASLRDKVLKQIDSILKRN